MTLSPPVSVCLSPLLCPCVWSQSRFLCAFGRRRRQPAAALPSPSALRPVGPARASSDSFQGRPALSLAAPTFSVFCVWIQSFFCHFCLKLHKIAPLNTTITQNTISCPKIVCYTLTSIFFFFLLLSYKFPRSHGIINCESILRCHHTSAEKPLEPEVENFPQGHSEVPGRAAPGHRDLTPGWASVPHDSHWQPTTGQREVLPEGAWSAPSLQLFALHTPLLPPCWHSL